MYVLVVMNTGTWVGLNGYVTERFSYLNLHGYTFPISRGTCVLRSMLRVVCLDVNVNTTFMTSCWW